MPKFTIWPRPFSTVGRRIERLIGGYDKTVDKLAGQLTRGEITLEQWERKTRDELRRLHKAAAITTLQKTDLTQSHYGRLGQILRTEYGHLHGFSQDIWQRAEQERLGIIGANGRPVRAMSEKMLLYRSKLYGQRARGTMTRFASLGIPVGATVAWINSQASSEICDDCKALARGGPYQWGVSLQQTPGDGKTRCGGQCHCHLSVLKMPDPGAGMTDRATGGKGLGAVKGFARSIVGALGRLVFGKMVTKAMGTRVEFATVLTDVENWPDVLGGFGWGSAPVEVGTVSIRHGGRHYVFCDVGTSAAIMRFFADDVFEVSEISDETLQTWVQRLMGVYADIVRLEVGDHGTPWQSAALEFIARTDGVSWVQEITKIVDSITMRRYVVNRFTFQRELAALVRLLQWGSVGQVDTFKILDVLTHGENGSGSLSALLEIMIVARVGQNIRADDFVKRLQNHAVWIDYRLMSDFLSDLTEHVDSKLGVGRRIANKIRKATPEPVWGSFDHVVRWVEYRPEPVWVTGVRRVCFSTKRIPMDQVEENVARSISEDDKQIVSGYLSGILRRHGPIGPLPVDVWMEWANQNQS